MRACANSKCVSTAKPRRPPRRSARHRRGRRRWSTRSASPTPRSASGATRCPVSTIARACSAGSRARPIPSALRRSRAPPRTCSCTRATGGTSIRGAGRNIDVLLHDQSRRVRGRGRVLPRRAMHRRAGPPRSADRRVGDALARPAVAGRRVLRRAPVCTTRSPRGQRRRARPAVPEPCANTSSWPVFARKRRERRRGARRRPVLRRARGRAAPRSRVGDRALPHERASVKPDGHERTRPCVSTWRGRTRATPRCTSATAPAAPRSARPTAEIGAANEDGRQCSRAKNKIKTVCYWGVESALDVGAAVKTAGGWDLFRAPDLLDFLNRGVFWSFARRDGGAPSPRCCVGASGISSNSSKSSSSLCGRQPQPKMDETSPPSAARASTAPHANCSPHAPRSRAAAAPPARARRRRRRRRARKRETARDLVVVDLGGGVMVGARRPSARARSTGATRAARPR